VLFRSHQSASQPSQSVTLTARLTNEAFELAILDIVLRQIEKRRVERVVVGGLAFKGKPETYDVRGSLGITILNHLKNNCKGVETQVWEQQVPLHLVPGDFTPIKSREHLASANLIILANNASFLSSEWLRFAITKNPDLTIIDVWGIVPLEYRSLITYKLVGDGNAI